MSTAAQNVADMDAKSTNVGTSFATDPEDTHISLLVVVEELAFVDSSHSELLLDGRDQWRSLEDGTDQAQQSLFNLLDFLDVLVKLDDSNVLFTSRLLSLDQTGSVVNACNEATCDLGIEGTRVAYHSF